MAQPGGHSGCETILVVEDEALVRSFVIPACPAQSVHFPLLAEADTDPDGGYLFERRQVAGAVPNTFLNARENAASEL